MTITMRDRCRGAMVGTHYGDSAGAPYEWKWTPEKILEDIQKRGGLVPHEYKPFDYLDPWKGIRHIEMGQPTDDSELAAALAQSLVEHPEFNPEDLYNRLHNFIIRRKSILSEVAYGSGGTLRRALNFGTYAESCAAFSRGEVQMLQSNGALMRTVPIALRYQGDVADLIKYARWQSCVTHMHPVSQAACIAYCVLVSSVFEGHEIREAWKITQRILGARNSETLIPDLEEMLTIDLSKPEYEKDIKGQEGWVVLSLRTALWASINAKDFADGIIKVISLGGDTDTYGAIAGGILGARFGIQAIPEQWLNVLQGREVMIDLADKLYDIAHS